MLNDETDNRPDASLLAFSLTSSLKLNFTYENGSSESALKPADSWGIADRRQKDVVTTSSHKHSSLELDPRTQIPPVPDNPIIWNAGRLPYLTLLYIR